MLLDCWAMTLVDASSLTHNILHPPLQVRHPNVVHETFFDLDILFYFVHMGSYFTSVFSVPFDRHAFGDLLQKQVDLTYEACNLKKFAENFSSEMADGSVSFPQISQELLSPSVLIEGWAQGEVLVDFLEGWGKDAVEQARDKIETFTQNLGDQVCEGRGEGWGVREVGRESEGKA